MDLKIKRLHLRRISAQHGVLLSHDELETAVRAHRGLAEYLQQATPAPLRIPGLAGDSE